MPIERGCSRCAGEAGTLAVWLDDRQIETFASISASIESGLACSKALVAFDSHVYPTRRPCQWS
jgi:hypothetical protein